MKRALLIALGFLALLCGRYPALAADMPVKAPPVRAPAVMPIFGWTGFYGGFNIGYGWGRSTIHDLDDFCLGAGTCPTPRVRYDFDGIVGGVQAGYNWQAASWVFGVEFDISASGLSGSLVFRPPGPAILSTDIDWFGTGRLRLGYTGGHWLAYVTGGFAVADVENVMQSGTTVARISDVEWGWTIGGGLEYAFAPQWTVRGEYLFLDLERSGIASVPPPSVGRFDWDNRFHVVRGALNYRFAPLR